MEKVVKFFCIIGVVGLLFCFSNSPSLAQVKVGVMFSMTGPGSVDGQGSIGWCQISGQTG